MPHLLWDASGLTKRYALEVGTPTANALFAVVPPLRMATTHLGYTETFAALWRKRNRGQLADAPFQEVASALRSEVLGGHFHLEAVQNEETIAATELVQRYSLNASDAIILMAFLRYAKTAGDVCVVIAADGRLVKAAEAEGLRGLSPELLPAADVPAFLASL